MKTTEYYRHIYGQPQHKAVICKGYEFWMPSKHGGIWMLMIGRKMYEPDRWTITEKVSGLLVSKPEGYKTRKAAYADLERITGQLDAHYKPEDITSEWLRDAEEVYEEEFIWR